MCACTCVVTQHMTSTMNTKVKQNMANGKKEGIGKEPKRGSGGNTVRSVERIMYATVVGK